MPNDSSPPPIGRYRPLVKLGTGGMADVYLAVSRTASGLEKLAVIKRLRPEVADDPEELAHFKGMFWDEAKLAMLLNHANVVHTHDACEEGGSLYIVMEYIEGQSLNAVQRELARRSDFLSPVHACLVLSEILAGLHYAHELRDLSGDHLNIVHRDVSPQNILLGYDGSVKLVDFGVAKASTRSTETRAGTLKGKARYMAPEQVLNKGVDRRADVYAAGVVLWELIARRKLVAGANMVEQLVNVIKTEPDRLSSVVPDVDPELDAIVHTAIAREPAHRYQTGLAFREALLSYVSRKGDARVAELGILVSRVFGPKRDEVSRTIRERLAIDAAREASGADPITAPNLFFDDDRSDRSLPSIQSGAKSGTSQVSFTPHAVVQTTQTTPPPIGSKKTVPLLVGSLMLLLLVVGGLAGVLVSNSRARRETVGSPQPPPPPVALPEPKVEKHADPPPTPPPAIEAKPAIEVKPAVEAPKAIVRAPDPPRAPVPRWTPTPTAAPAPPPPQPAATSPEESQGYLTIDTYPWTKVSENGRVLGNTPLVRVPLAAGTHVLTLENPTDGVKQTTTVIVKSGETISKRLAF